MTPNFPDPLIDIPAADEGAEAVVVLAGGCFWCTEAVFVPLKGVLGVRSGYTGDSQVTANYEAVCSGRTNHAEAIEVRYDPKQVSFGQLLKVFFEIAHDPTQMDRQGNDLGRQYRSSIFYASEAQLKVAEAYIHQLNQARVFPTPIVTRLEPLTVFYEAEPYHQRYAARNPTQPYVRYAALPKVEKLKKSGTALKD
jgi:peptide-methionine (S)-S-oxide reductase